MTARVSCASTRCCGYHGVRLGDYMTKRRKKRLHRRAAAQSPPAGAPKAVRARVAVPWAKWAIVATICAILQEAVSSLPPLQGVRWSAYQFAMATRPNGPPSDPRCVVVALDGIPISKPKPGNQGEPDRQRTDREHLRRIVDDLVAGGARSVGILVDFGWWRNDRTDPNLTPMLAEDEALARHWLTVSKRTPVVVACARGAGADRRGQPYPFLPGDSGAVMAASPRWEDAAEEPCCVRTTVGGLVMEGVSAKLARLSIEAAHMPIPTRLMLGGSGDVWSPVDFASLSRLQATTISAYRGRRYCLDDLLTADRNLVRGRIVLLGYAEDGWSDDKAMYIPGRPAGARQTAHSVYHFACGVESLIRGVWLVPTWLAVVLTVLASVAVSWLTQRDGFLMARIPVLSSRPMWYALYRATVAMLAATGIWVASRWSDAIYVGSVVLAGTEGLSLAVEAGADQLHLRWTKAGLASSAGDEQ